MLASENQSVRDEVISYFATRFGVAEAAFARIVFIPRTDDVWAASALAPATLTILRPPGVRAVRRWNGGLKPTSVFLRFLGGRITAARVEIEDCAILHTVLRGGTIPARVTLGYVALVFRGDVIGCGIARADAVKAVIPTGRRQALLEIISAGCDLHHGNLPPDSGNIVLD